LARSIRHAIERQRLVTSVRGANRLLSEKNSQLVELCDTAHRFVDNVSHEFRTPLTVIKEFSSLMMDGLCGPLNHEQRHAAQIISDRADDLACMVNDMMDVSRLKAGILSMWRRSTRLADVMFHIRPMLERRAARGEVRLQIDELEGLPEAFCDAGKISQIISNLVINAIKFTNPGGCVRVWAHVADNARLMVGVTDNGQGIEPDKLRVIFERFTQLNHDIVSSTKGVGLGLAIVKEFVSLNLGEIFVESECGKGSTFFFSLPLADPAAVFDCYISGLRKQSENTSIGLLEARLVKDSDKAATPVIDEFLQRAARPQDIVWMGTPGEWSILVNGPVAIAADIIDRIRCEWVSTCRNWIYGSPPELVIQSCGQWEREQIEALRSQFCMAAGASHRCEEAVLSEA
jgi:nitrogen-specific signal transduction histidine kinase